MVNENQRALEVYQYGNLFKYTMLNSFYYQQYLILMSKIPNLQIITKQAKYGAGNIAGKIFFGIGVVTGIFSISSFFESWGAQKQIQFRKQQLKLPVYKLTQQQMVNPPWNHDNIDSWLYRRVQVIGRPIPRLAISIPCNRFDQPGFNQVVPLVTREDKQHKNRKGLLLSVGFVPFDYRHPTCRERIERVDRQKFIGFVSRLDEFKNQSWFKGNAYQKGRLYYTNADMQDFGKSCELLNQQQASIAVIERLHQTGRLDQRSSERYGVDCHFTQPYPWAKTESGALQLKKMPWEHTTDARNYFIASITSFVIGASIF